MELDEQDRRAALGGQARGGHHERGWSIVGEHDHLPGSDAAGAAHELRHFGRQRGGFARRERGRAIAGRRGGGGSRSGSPARRRPGRRRWGASPRAPGSSPRAGWSRRCTAAARRAARSRARRRPAPRASRVRPTSTTACGRVLDRQAGIDRARHRRGVGRRIGAAESGGVLRRQSPPRPGCSPGRSARRRSRAGNGADLPQPASAAPASMATSRRDTGAFIAGHYRALQRTKRCSAGSPAYQGWSASEARRRNRRSGQSPAFAG